MSRKSNVIYKIIVGVTLIAPLAIYMFLSATLFNIKADVIVENGVVSDLILVDDFVYSNNDEIVYNGSITTYNGNYGFFVDEETIIQTDDGYFSVEDNQFIDIKAMTIRQETSYRLPLSFIVSALGVGIVFMVINKKMQWYKQFPRTSTLIGLAVGTLTLFMLDVIVSNLLYVFLVATISWALYCVEYMVKENILTEDEGKKADSSLIKILKESLNG